MNGKELRRWARFRVAVFLPRLIGVLPEPWGRGLCAAVGWAGHLLVARDRRLARGNLGRVHPEWPDRRIRREARRVFVEIGRNVYDFVRYPSLSTEARTKLVTIDGREHLDAAVAGGRGAIIVTGHLGSWEVLAAALVHEGYPVRALARPLREPRLDRALAEHRRRMGVRTLSSESLPIGALRHLRRGGFLGVLADQRIKRGGVTVEFLGQTTPMTDGPARLAAASGAPVIPLGIRRLPDDTHRVTVLPPLPPESDARRATQTIAHALEELIRQAPEQWIWIHPRWEIPARPRVPRTSRFGRFVFPALLAIFSVVGCVGDEPEQGAPAETTSLEREIRDFNLTETHEGRLAWNLHSKYAWRIPKQPGIRLDDVLVTFYDREEAVTSTLTAEKGVVDEESGDMTAEGRVTVVTAGRDSLFTPSLRYSKTENIITGDEFVRIAKPDRILTGFGFRSNPELTNYEVQRDVHVTFIDRARTVAP